MTLYILRIVHVVILVFVLFGWLIPNKGLLIFHALFLPGMVVQWWLNNGDCFLTNIEHAIVKKISNEPLPEKQDDFVESLFKKYLNWSPSEKQLLAIIYFFVLLSWSLSLNRIFAWL